MTKATQKIKLPTYGAITLVDFKKVQLSLEQLKIQGIELSENKKNWVYKSIEKVPYYLTKNDGSKKEIIFTYKSFLNIKLSDSMVLCYEQKGWEQTLIDYVNEHTKICVNDYAQKINIHVKTLLDRAYAMSPELMDEDSFPVKKVQEQLRTLHLSNIERLEKKMEIILKQWEAGTQLLQKAQELNEMLNLSDYPRSFEMARELKRSISIYVGPTNSGKSYQAFEELSKSNSGVYLAPLRLLAMEGFERLNDLGVACSLVTGEERNIDSHAKFVSSTVEMADLETAVDVAVIDEAQLLSDPDRGWAWTNAICGMPAKKLIIITAPEGLDAVKKLSERLGETYIVKEFERKSALKVLEKPVGLGGIKKGDALIAFSRREVLWLKERLEKSGQTCSVIYGALGPEVRKIQAKNFAQGKVDCLVSTDAIGMGLNLPIERIIFTTTQKFNGMFTTNVPHSLVRQISGRAGRFGLSTSGSVSALEGEDLQYIKECMKTDVEQFSGPLQIAPFDSHIQKISKVLNENQVHKILIFFKNHLGKEGTMFCASNMETQIELAQKADRYNLPLLTRFKYSKAPMDLKSEEHMEVYASWLRHHTKGHKIGVPQMIIAGDALFLHEQQVRLLSSYCWLSYQFEDVFTEREKAQEKRMKLTQTIEKLLKSKEQSTGHTNSAKKLKNS